MKKRILTVSLLLALAAILIIGASIAYFTDTEEKTNIFTIGKVDITLSEDNWDNDVNNKDLIPGKTIPKDPTITVEEESQTAYTFMKVELSNDFLALLKAYATANNDMQPNDVIGKWFYSTVKPKIMHADIDEGYVILGVLSPKKAGESVTYFDEVIVPADVTQEMINETGDYSIKITAYAIQAEGFYEGATADEATKQANRQAAFYALFPELVPVP